ncbi:4743_t:CDS:2 [Diversispora eburnea]|uniref:4743_t:CDS:1 n=1 Tax=Diversispora eburnea TaxID=1213867 RepID=A0A9N8UY62_9GLOM|nr:4743_t:CDS:2 [Diversispora eburnea]
MANRTDRQSFNKIYEPFSQQNKIKIPDSEEIKQIITSIDSTILTKIKKHTFLPLEDLVTPHPRKNRFHKEPRPQNPFVIYRRNIQAKIAAESGSQYGSQLDYVSKVASTNNQEIHIELPIEQNDYSSPPLLSNNQQSVSSSSLRPLLISPPLISPNNNNNNNMNVTSPFRHPSFSSISYTQYFPPNLPPIWSALNSGDFILTIPPLNTYQTTTTYSNTLIYPPINGLNNKIPTANTHLILPSLEVNISKYLTYVHDRNILASLIPI